MKESKKTTKAPVKVKDLEPETDPRGGFAGGVRVGSDVKSPTLGDIVVIPSKVKS